MQALVVCYLYFFIQSPRLILSDAVVDGNDVITLESIMFNFCHQTINHQSLFPNTI